MDEFVCPYCHTASRVDLAPELQHPFGVVVCAGCAGYVLRQDGEWIPMTYEMTGTIARRAPALLTMMEGQRVAFVKRWVEEEELPPTVFAAVLAQLVRERGYSVCLHGKPE